MWFLDQLKHVCLLGWGDILPQFNSETVFLETGSDFRFHGFSPTTLPPPTPLTPTHRHFRFQVSPVSDPPVTDWRLP